MKWRISSLWIYAVLCIVNNCTLHHDDVFMCLLGDLLWLMENKVQKCVDGQVMCLVCGRQLTTMGSLKRHMKEVHTTPKRYCCPICNSTFINRGFYLHIRQNHSSWTDVDYERYRCDSWIPKLETPILFHGNTSLNMMISGLFQMQMWGSRSSRKWWGLRCSSVLMASCV